MKKPVIISLFAICLVFTFIESVLSQETLTHGCYHWRTGYFRIVANENQCRRRFENYISFHQAIPPGGFALDLYVNGSSGQDLPGAGLTPTDALKTIGYAIELAMYLRPNQEIETVINVAPGNYFENLVIKGDNIWLKKDENLAGDVNIDGGGQDVITIVAARGVHIRGVIVQNGYFGINGIRGAVFEVEDTIIQDNGNDGIRMDENSASRLFDLTVLRNGDEGIEVIRNSNAALMGSILSKQNKSAGLVIAANSSVWCEVGTTLVISENGGQGLNRGIQIGNSSNFIALDTDITIQDNHGDGIGMVRNSTMSVHHPSTLNVKNNRYGINLTNSTFLAANIEISKNSNTGIVADDGSSVNLSNSNIIDNTGADVYLTFCSRASLYGNFGLVNCDECSRVRGDAFCK